MEPNKIEDIEDIEEFINKKNIFAVIGVSQDTNKYGRKVFDDLKKYNYSVFPINPKEEFILNSKCYKNLKSLPVKPDVVSFVIPPAIGIHIIMECKELGIDKVWLQPGSESEEIIEYCKDNKIGCLHHQCVLLNLK